MLIIRENGGSVTPPSGAATYTVQRNDNLTEIAARFGTTVAELVRLNNIANPNLIYPGQVLIIRENGGSVTPPSGAVTYTVQRNDNLTEIADALWHHGRGTGAPQQHRQPEPHLPRTGADHPRERRLHASLRHDDLHRAAQ